MNPTKALEILTLAVRKTPVSVSNYEELDQHLGNLALINQALSTLKEMIDASAAAATDKQPDEAAKSE